MGGIAVLLAAIAHYTQKRRGKEVENYSEKAKKNVAGVKAMVNNVFVTIAFIYAHTPRQIACVALFCFFRVHGPIFLFARHGANSGEIFFSKINAECKYHIV